MKRYIARVEDGAAVHAVAEQVEGTGADVHVVLDRRGVLSFSATDEVLSRVKALPAVRDVEVERQCQMEGDG